MGCPVKVFIWKPVLLNVNFYTFWQRSQEHPTLNNTYQGKLLKGFDSKSVRVFQFVSICSLFSNRHRAVPSGGSGCWGGTLFEDQLTLFQQGAHYAHPITTWPPGISALRQVIKWFEIAVLELNRIIWEDYFCTFVIVMCNFFEIRKICYWNCFSSI